VLGGRVADRTDHVERLDDGSRDRQRRREARRPVGQQFFGRLGRATGGVLVDDAQELDDRIMCAGEVARDGQNDVSVRGARDAIVERSSG
jgi:hypothetical protein